MGSTVTSNLSPYLEGAFGVAPGPQAVLPASVYLVGFMFGPLIFAPLSESHGRKPILTAGFVLFALSVLGSALAPTWPSFLLFRFLTGTFGSPPLSVIGGVVADVFGDEAVRGRMIMIWSAATVVGPLSGPIISGFVSPLGWRWTFWIAFIVAVVSLGAVIALPETLASKILMKKAAKMNKQAGSRWFIAPADRTTLSRPLYLLCTEMLLSLTCVYMAFLYAVFYMLVRIFPFIFQGVYGFSAGISGVAFSIMGLGTFAACFAFLWYDSIAPSISAKHPEKKAEYLRLPVACASGPAFVVSILWLGWASKPDVPWIVPLLAMVPYGFAYQLIYTAMINYIADAYGIYSASALAACAMTRSIAGALIPLATDKMLESLGISWSCTVLAVIGAGLGFVPLLFIMYGEKIRQGSRFSASLRVQTGNPQGPELMRSLSAV
ncbi:major facilitator superfamily domain-containing protein [Lasiosphaeris hirsuta]|uniref:Major facilitator superfamily domain-containing protein n=1 Tax=Lasiosphaeris hirsuta TaxID=260670 RepID=A0AA40AQU0_9PEZI|nr:major facilitator superfamily domain-containing protein [Lasiosphaeris hirsuta]